MKALDIEKILSQLKSDKRGRIRGKNRAIDEIQRLAYTETEVSANYTESAPLVIPPPNEGNRLVNFLWEQYKINRLITKKQYLRMIEEAKKVTNN